MTGHPTVGADAAPATPDRRALLRVVASVMVPAWGRCVVAIVALTLLFGAAGESELSGYALVPAIFLCLSPPVGGRGRRMVGATLACLVVAATVTVGASLSESTVATALGLAVAGFVSALLPRVGPLAAALQIPIIIAFAYSAGQPLGDASAWSRGLAVVAALPVYVLAAAVVFAVEQRRPLRLGAAAALGALGQALGSDEAGAYRDGAARASTRFRAALLRLRDQAIPLGSSSDDRAGLALVGAVQQAIVATALLSDGDAPADPERRRASAHALGGAAAELGGALAEPARPLPDGAPLDALRAQALAAPDRPLALLADALLDARDATARLRHDRSQARPGDLVSHLPRAPRRVLLSLRPADPVFRRAIRLAVACGAAGLTAGLLDLGRAYWPVFAVIIVFNAPVAQDWRRAVNRIAGTLAGIVVAVPLVPVAADHPGLGFTIALLGLLPGLLLMPINYGAAVGFITVTVGLLFASGGNQDEFLDYRFEDQLVGAAIAVLIGLSLWHTRRGQWWRAARQTATALADAVADPRPQRRHDALVMDLLVLRTETAEGVALRGSERPFAPAWIFTAAAQQLVRTLTGPHAEPVADPPGLAARLRRIAADCHPAGDGAPPAPRAPAPHRDAALEEVAEMEQAIDALQARPAPGG